MVYLDGLFLYKENKTEGKAMCYGIRELVGKKTREDTIVQRPGSPEIAGRSKVEALMRAWLGKSGYKRGAPKKKERPLEIV
jgi:hypothetical protein